MSRPMSRAKRKHLMRLVSEWVNGHPAEPGAFARWGNFTSYDFSAYARACADHLTPNNALLAYLRKGRARA